MRVLKVEDTTDTRLIIFESPPAWNGIAFSLNVRLNILDVTIRFLRYCRRHVIHHQKETMALPESQR